MNTRQAGFTLIELVMVIVILGILAAFALPRFADLGGQARISTLEGIAGAMRSSAGIAHSMSLATGNTASVNLEGAAIDLINEYPDRDFIATAAGIDAASWGIDVATAGEVTFTVNGRTAGTCSVKYTEAAAGAAPVVSAPVTGGC